MMPTVATTQHYSLSAPIVLDIKIWPCWMALNESSHIYKWVKALPQNQPTSAVVFFEVFFFFKDNRLQFKCGMAIMVHPSRDGLVVLLFLQYQLKLNQVPDPKWLQIPLRGLKIHKNGLENTCFFGPKKSCRSGTSLPPLRNFFLLPKSSSGFGWYPTAFEESQIAKSQNSFWRAPWRQW